MGRQKSERSYETTDVQFFISRYRNEVRDLVAYGNKAPKEDQKKSLTAKKHDHYEVINALHSALDELEWDNRNLYYKHMPEGFDRNPFLKLYLFKSFGNYPLLVNCIHTLFVMNPDLVELELEYYYSSEEKPPKWERNRENDYERLAIDREKNNGFSTTGLYAAITPFSDREGFERDSRTKTIGNHLEELSKLGIILKDGAGRANVWYKEQHTLRGLMSSAATGGETQALPFDARFLAAMEFFSRYADLGAYGQQILLRLLPVYPRGDYFRFRQEYLHNALNDFLMISLLYAIENRLWCRLYVRHGQDARGRRTVFCRPVEIRKGDATGRTFLMLYDPRERNIKRERVDFIDEIFFYDPDEEGQRDIENAGALLEYTWGVSMPRALDRQGNASKALNLKPLRFIVSAPGEEGEGLYEKIKRQSRTGSVRREKDKIVFEITVPETIELRPFLRELYGYLDQIGGMEDGIRKSSSELYQVIDFLKTDLEELEAHYLTTSSQPAGYEKTGKAPKKKKDTQKGNGSIQQQSLIFSEYYGIYYHILGNIITEHAKTGAGIEAIKTKVLSTYADYLGTNTGREMTDACDFLIKDANLMNQEGERRYYIREKDVYFGTDIMPLTKPEQKWLRSVFEQEPYSRLFFTKNELRSMCEYLDPKVTPFNTDKIVHHERYKPVFDPDKKKNTELFLQVLYAINRRSEIQVTCPGKEKTILPLKIEYSMKDNEFCVLGTKNNTMCRIPLHRVRKASVQDRKTPGHSAGQKAILDQSMKDRERCVTISFVCDDLITDRVLSEFSYLKKKFEHVAKDRNDLHQLTIWYHADEEQEVAERILSHGRHLSICDENHPVLELIRRRIVRQREHMRMLEERRSSELQR